MSFGMGFLLTVTVLCQHTNSLCMTMLTAHIDNSNDTCRDICTVDIFIVVLLVVLHVSGTNHNHPEYRLMST